MASCSFQCTRNVRNIARRSRKGNVVRDQEINPGENQMKSTPEQVEQQILAAHAAYEKARDVEPDVRGSWLEAIASALEANADELVGLGAQETHLDEGRLRFELKRTVFQLRLFRSEIIAGEHLDAVI